MFSNLWYLLTFNWKLIGLPTTDPLKLPEYYTSVYFNPNEFKGDRKKLKKYFLEVVGGRKMKYLFDSGLYFNKSFVPEHLFPYFSLAIDTKGPGLYHHIITRINDNMAIQLFIETKHLEKLQSRKDYDPHVLKVRTNRWGLSSAARFESGSVHNAICNIILRRNDKWKKKIPEECGNCGHPIRNLYPNGACFNCGEIPDVILKVLKKESGLKDPSTYQPYNDIRIFKESRKSKYKKELIPFVDSVLKIRDPDPEELDDLDEEEDMFY